MKIGSHGKTRRVNHTIELLADIPCRSPEAHKDYQKGDRCWLCLTEWQSSLPWYSPYHYRPDEDEALFYVLDTFRSDREGLQSKKRFSSIQKDFLRGYGDEWLGYTQELYGIEVREFENIDEFEKRYPYWRITRRDKPNQLTILLRTRICYEPQIVECPIYLEMQYRSWRGSHTSIEGLNYDLEIGMRDIAPLLRVRDFLLNREPAKLLSLTDPLLLNRYAEFEAAAIRLGQERLEYSIQNLCQWYGRAKNDKNPGYKTRKPFYDFLDQVKAGKDGEKIAKEIKQLLVDEYQKAKRAPQPKKDTIPE